MKKAPSVAFGLLYIFWAVVLEVAPDHFLLTDS